MKKIIGLFAALVLTFTVNASTAMHMGAGISKVTADNEEGIHFFKGSWKEALEKAKVENKLIFLDAYASWCGPCKIMARTAFKEKAVGEFFNSNFINVKMDMEKNEDGRRLSLKYKLRAYPTLYFVNDKEEIVYEELGMQKGKQLITMGKKALAQ